MLATARARQNAFIGTFLLMQLLVPLRYYLSGGGPDERFSWRMFSTVRLQRCKVQVDALADDGTRDIHPGKDVQVAWVHMLERNRPSVVERYLERVCEQHGASEARYERRCIEPDGTEPPPDRMALRCATHELVTDGATP